MRATKKPSCASKPRVHVDSRMFEATVANRKLLAARYDIATVVPNQLASNTGRGVNL